eukprot:6273475-Amphidinium_carterae.3
MHQTVPCHSYLCDPQKQSSLPRMCMCRAEVWHRPVQMQMRCEATTVTNTDFSKICEDLPLISLLEVLQERNKEHSAIQSSYKNRLNRLREALVLSSQCQRKEGSGNKRILNSRGKFSSMKKPLPFHWELDKRHATLDCRGKYFDAYWLMTSMKMKVTAGSVARIHEVALMCYGVSVQTLNNRMTQYHSLDQKYKHQNMVRCLQHLNSFETAGHG